MIRQRKKPPVIDAGDVAPDFELVSTRGKALRLAELRDRNRVLLLFYPWNLRGG